MPSPPPYTVHPTLSRLLLSPSLSRAFFGCGRYSEENGGKDSIHMVTFPRGRRRWFSPNSKESLLCTQKRTKPFRKREKRKSGLLNNSPRNFRGGIGEGQHALGGVLMNEESISGKGFFPLSSFVGERRRRSWLFFLPAGNCLRLEDVSIWTHSLLNRPTQVGGGRFMGGVRSRRKKRTLTRGFYSISSVPQKKKCTTAGRGRDGN